MNNKPCGLHIERLNGGQPILAPTGNWWETGVTFNSAVTRLERSALNDPLIAGLLGPAALEDPALQDGVVVLHYRARPKEDPGHKWTRSFVGLAVSTPELKPLKRLAEPVVSPGADAAWLDLLGCEDPRVTRLGEDFYMAFCAVMPDDEKGFQARVALARSKNLLDWEKLGPVRGGVNFVNNKDGVLFPETIDGHYFLLHRPMVEPLSDFSMHLAMSETPEGEWRDCGMILHSFKNPNCPDSWVGAGSVPIPLGGKRWLILYHTGNWLHSGDREYDLDAAIFNFNNFDPEHPERIVERRLEPLMVPETEIEIKAPYSDSVANVLFSCGTYEHQGWLYIIYGGGDTFILAARVRMGELLERLGRCDTRNPFNVED